MGASQLTHPGHRNRFGSLGAEARAHPERHVRLIALAYAAIWALTFVGALLGAIAPSLAPGGRPHPTLHGNPAEVVSIAAVNLRALSAPFILALFGFATGRRSRRLGDLVVGVLLAGNTLRVGIAIGRWHTALLPYLPQLPVEWLAAALAAAAWLTLRAGGRRQTILAWLAAIFVLVVVAAAIETTCTPHAANVRATASGARR
jgi:hypothetical protein